MSSQILKRSFVADVAIPQYSLVKRGSDVNHVTLATGPTDAILGIVSDTSPAIGERVDVTLVGIDRVTAGAAFAVDVPLTTDASGRVVAAAPAAGVNNRIIGFAFGNALAAGDVVEVLIAHGQVQG